MKNMIRTRKKSASSDIWCGTAIILLIVAVAPRERRVSRNELLARPNELMLVAPRERRVSRNQEEFPYNQL